MSMSQSMRRLWNLITGRAEKAISSLENPEDQLRHFVTELDREMTQLKQSVTLALTEEKKIKGTIADELQRAAEWEKKAVFALNQGQEDLAREALVRKGDCEQKAMALKASWEQQHDAVQKLKHSLGLAQEKAEKAKRDYTILLARYKTAKTQQNLSRQLNGGQLSDSGALMEQINQKILQVEAESEAEMEMIGHSGNHELESQFAQIEKKMKGDEALAQLKSKMAGGHLLSEPSKQTLTTVTKKVANE